MLVKLRINDSIQPFLLHGSRMHVYIEINPEHYLGGWMFYRNPTRASNFHLSRNFKPGTLSIWSFWRFFQFIRFFGKTGDKSLVSNYYYPELTIRMIKKKFPFLEKRISVQLNIDFVNVKENYFDFKHQNQELKNLSEGSILLPYPVCTLIKAPIVENNVPSIMVSNPIVVKKLINIKKYESNF